MDKQHGNPEQVWQRVLSGPRETPPQDLRQLQREAMELAAVYRNLAGQLAGKCREQAHRLYLVEKANADALNGLGILTRQGGEAVKIWQPGKEPARKLLERCYHQTRRCMTEYMARSADGEFGTVFRKLADREEQQCLLIAQLLGILG